MTNHCLDGKSDSHRPQTDMPDSGIQSAIRDCYTPTNISRSDCSANKSDDKSKHSGHLDIPDIFAQIDHSGRHHGHQRHSRHHRHHDGAAAPVESPIPTIEPTKPISDKPSSPPESSPPAEISAPHDTTGSTTTDSPSIPTDKAQAPNDGTQRFVGADKMPVGALTQTLSVLDQNPTNLSVDQLRNLKAQGISGVRDKYELPKDRLLNASELAFLDRDYAAARAADMPMITIFSYTQQTGGADAPADLIKAQLAQIAPILSKNEDTIGAVELGFVGAWGEWNRSSNGNDNNTALAKDIYDGFTKALPGTPVAFRYAHLVREIFGDNPPANVIMQNDSIGESHGTAYRDKDAGSYLYDGDYEYIVKHNLMTIGENQETGTPAEILKRVQDTNITSMEFWGSVGQAVKSQGMYDDIIAAMQKNALEDGIAF